MGLMVRRPSRIVIALARWALMAGLAGVVLAMLAFIDRFRAPENLASRRNLLIVAAVLLSLSFVLAPFVRRAFGIVLTAQAKRDERKTLLDEMREQPEGEWQPSTDSSAPATPPPGRSLAAKLILALYLAFGAALVAVMLAMR
jgi:hypothetical protein